MSDDYFYVSLNSFKESLLKVTKIAIKIANYNNPKMYLNKIKLNIYVVHVTHVLKLHNVI